MPQFPWLLNCVLDDQELRITFLVSVAVQSRFGCVVVAGDVVTHVADVAAKTPACDQTPRFY